LVYASWKLDSERPSFVTSPSCMVMLYHAQSMLNFSPAYLHSIPSCLSENFHDSIGPQLATFVLRG